jgi:hypothetical protein
MKERITAWMMCSLLAGCGAGAGADRGRFHLSASVADSCKPPGLPAAFCRDLQGFLAELSAESRDEEWAAAMEARIEKSLRVKGQPAGEIRSLECRRTLCAVEFVVDPARIARADGDAELELAMEPRTGGLAYESGGASGRHRLVTVMCWQKRRDHRA